MPRPGPGGPHGFPRGREGPRLSPTEKTKSTEISPAASPAAGRAIPARGLPGCLLYVIALAGGISAVAALVLSLF